MKQMLCTMMTAVACHLQMAAQTTINIKNATNSQRSEVVSIPAEKLGIAPFTDVIIRDASKIDQQTQWTHDGRLLMSVYVLPHGATSYTVLPGKSKAITHQWVYGRQFPERLDDISFENDRIGFRLYGPALQRRGEKGYGHDVWLKRTTSLVLEELYRNNPGLSFHLDYGKALDCYAVGPTLGCGTPALLRQGKIVFPWCYQNYRILDYGPLRFTVQVDFPTIDGVTEHRVLSLDKGSNFCQAWVWYDGLSQPTDIAAGLAIRPTKPDGITMGDGFVSYTDPTIDPKKHQFQIYVALVFPDTAVTIRQQESHALGIWQGYREGRFHYLFGAAWSEFDVRSPEEWQLRINTVMEAHRHPLTVEIVKN